MVRHLSYESVPTHDDDGQKLTLQQAKKQRFHQIQADADEIYKAVDVIEAIRALKLFVNTWKPLESKAIETFLANITLTFNFYAFDQSLHPLIRTSNALERFFRHFRNKADKIGAFPNQESCLTLFFLVLQREHAKHDGLKNRGE